MIFSVIWIISGSRVFSAATRRNYLTQRLTFDGDDELGDDGENFAATPLEHVKDALDREKSVRSVLFADTFEEFWQVVMVVE